VLVYVPPTITYFYGFNRTLIRDDIIDNYHFSKSGTSGSSGTVKYLALCLLTPLIEYPRLVFLLPGIANLYKICATHFTTLALSLIHPSTIITSSSHFFTQHLGYKSIGSVLVSHCQDSPTGPFQFLSRRSDRSKTVKKIRLA
jgi:hypothetical protein